MRKKRINPNKVLPGVHGMLYKMAWKYAHPQFPLDDALQEAYIGFMKVCESFDPTRGMEFSSWCYFKVDAHLKTVIASQMKRQVFYFDPSTIGKALEGKQKEEGMPVSSKFQARLREIMEDLSADAREVLALLIDTPHDLIGDDIPTPKQLLARVVEHVRFERGLDRVDEKMIIYELRAELESILA